MNDREQREVVERFRQAIADCRNLYLDSGQICIEQYPGSLPSTPDDFLRRMGELHRGMLIKTYATIAEADQRWSRNEQLLAAILFEHLWGRSLKGTALREAAAQVFGDAKKLSWSSLVRPFATLPPLQDRIAELETLVMRLGNLIAKVDGNIDPREVTSLRRMQQQINEHLLLVHDQSDDSAIPPLVTAGPQQIELQQPNRSSPRPASQGTATRTKPAEVSLDEALKQLDDLVGLPGIKHEVRTLVNFLKLQQHRRQAGLPTTDLSLHMVFCGNPGTGKTTVARIIGRIYHALGILENGHLVETDRSGLVAQYAGQTGPKTNQKIDEALGGVLFIDEAYSLVADAAEDPYGQEAVQTLLKRMEDERHRLVVILAGYPEPMRRLLASNPGLSSRFNTQLNFEDYQPRDLFRIFERMCKQNHYELPKPTRQRLLYGLTWYFKHRDEHFGNGRLVRNEFERAVRRLANRIAGLAPLTADMLTVLEPEDLDFADVREKGKW